MVHTASPFPVDIPRDENVIIKPAVEGTLAVLKAAHKHRVKRVVITSSIASIAYKKVQGKEERYSEKNWSEVDACPPYEKSKLLAEKAAWDFHKSLPIEERFELVVINPGFVIGPNLIECEFTSSNLIKRLMSGLPGVAKIMLPLVDVRDVAQAHLNGLKKPDAANKRFVMVQDTVWVKDMMDMLRPEFGKYYSVPNKELSYIIFKAASLMDSAVKQAIPYWGRKFSYDNE